MTDFDFLNKRDTYSFLLSAISASEADDSYTLLADLFLALDEKSFKNFLSLFEGQTISIPTIEKLTSMLKAMIIYAYKDIEHMDLATTLKALKLPVTAKGPPEYQRLKNLLNDHQVEVGGVFSDFQKN